MSRNPTSPLRAFDQATRDIARAKRAIERRDQAAKQLYGTGNWTYQALAERSTKNGVPLTLGRMHHIVHGRADRRKEKP